MTGGMIEKYVFARIGRSLGGDADLGVRGKLDDMRSIR